MAYPGRSAALPRSGCPAGNSGGYRGRSQQRPS